MRSIAKTMYCEVAVVGGGVGGCTAAIELARKGLHVTIFEKGVSLGGLATNGYVPQFAGHIEGICKEYVHRLDDAGYLKWRSPDDDHNPSFDPEMGKFLLENMIMEYDGRIIYEATCIDVEMDPQDPRKIESVIFYAKGSLIRVKAQYFIDSTGVADVAAMAGVPFEVGGADFCGLNMSTTMGTLFAGFNKPAFEEADKAWRKQQMEETGCSERETESILYSKETQAIKEGRLTRHVANPYRGIFQVHIPNTPDDDMSFCTFSFHSYFCDNLDVVNVSRQIIEQHQMMKRFVEFLREEVPGYEKIRLVSTGNQHGERDSRRIFGDYMLKAADVACGTKFEDGIARFPEMFDTHHPTSGDLIFQRHIHLPAQAGTAICRENQCSADMHPFVTPMGVEARSNPRDYCDIPYRSLLPRGVDNLLAVGKCCSAEFHANGAMRIIGPAMGTGQAAGCAIAMAHEIGGTTRDVKGTEVRAQLISEGVALDCYPEGWWTKLRDTEGDFVVNSGDAISLIPKQ